MGDTLKQVILEAETLPPFTSSARKITALASNIDCAPADIVRVIETDPTMTVALIRLLNSDYFSMETPCYTVSEAVVTLGITTVKNIALKTGERRTLPTFTDADPGALGLHMHCAGTGMIARHLARFLALPPRVQDQALSAGLMHDLGKIALLNAMPAQYSSAVQKAKEQGVSLDVSERTHLDCDHSQVGQMLSEAWNLPEIFTITMGDHYESTLSISDERTFALFDCVTAANTIIQRKGFGTSGDPEPPKLTESAKTRFGISSSEALEKKLPPTLVEELNQLQEMLHHA
ncbi:MAG: HDOD domain-containing protein [Magnetococcales bacterium]|nr:HDOD domain-containing protein [Magnetococcales bacterium]